MSAALQDQMCVDRLEADDRAKPLGRAPVKDEGTSKKTAILPADLICRPGARELLLRWPELRALIPETFYKIRESFDTFTRVALSRFDDPEADTEAPSLYLVIGTTLKARDARRALDRFEDSWWMDNADRGNDHLHISVEFL